jgi:hypothetical protein
MWTLARLNEPGQNFAGGIQFAMTDGPRRITCWISREALDGIEGGNPSQEGRMLCFGRHRLKIERLASEKYDAGERRPIVMTFDLGADVRGG